MLDIQRMVDELFTRGRFGSILNYQRDPAVPLTPEDAAWADALLREKGLRSTAAP
jgi:hypothetical protein